MRIKIVRLTGVGVLAAVLGGASFAWACTNQANIAVQSGANTGANPKTSTSSSGPAGSEITVVGKEFGAGPVQIHWDSLTGREIAPRQAGPSFTAIAKVPTDARPGVYYIVAVQYTSTRTINGQGRASFEVTAPYSSTNQQTTAPDEQAAPDGGRSSTATSGAGSPGTDGGATSGTADASDANSVGATPASGRTSSSGLPAEDTGELGTAPTQSPGRSPARQPAATTTGSRSAAAPASAADADPGRAVFGPSVAPEASAVAAAPDARTATADLWSGFRSGTRPSLANGLADGPATSGDGSSPAGLALGLALAGAGAMMGGFAMAETRRRRALVRA